MHARNGWRGARAAVIAVTAAVAFVMSLLVPSVSDAPAHANPSDGFNAGNIIDDSLFYDGNAWDAGQIQTFLNQRVPRCTIGDPGREAYKPWGSTMIAGFCLRDGWFTYPSRPANAYCKAIAGGTRESSAQIIAKVGQACGISPKVLLVMLEKEQSLVTDSWPTVRQFDYAMGYACPDSGPGNSANCDPSQATFPNQVYRSAWQLKVYRAFPDSYNYQPNRWNTIQWHPNAGCGTSQVWIANWATAALYIYTPYRPNQAALDAGWGTGDACSSYGNRNFYNFYTSWFGSVRSGPQVHARFTDHWNRNGGASGKYGKPVASAVDHSGILTQQFENGMMYWNSWLGVTAVNGAISTRYRQLDSVMKLGPWGSLGYPVGDEIAVKNGVRQRFEKGEMYWSPQYGAQVVSGGILSYYLSKGGAGGSLGLPTGRMVSVAAGGGGWYQDFTGGTVFVNRSTGLTTSLSNGPFLRNYRSAGFVQGAWGWPTGHAACGLRDGGCTMATSSGVIAYSAGSGSHLVPSQLVALWKSPAGALRYPTTEALRAKTGRVQEFQGGIAMLPDGGSPSILKPEVAAAWRATGDGMRWLGAIRSGEIRLDAQRYYVDFDRGSLFFTAGKPAIRFGGGEFRRTYEANGGPRGPWGWPVEASLCNDRGVCTMNFTNGQAVYSPKSGVAFLTTEYLDLWRKFGGYSGSLKYPIGSRVAVSGGSYQEFEGGRVYVSSRGAVRFGAGAFLRTYIGLGGPAGSWGWPLSAGVCGLPGGACTMEFERGTAHYTPEKGVWFVARRTTAQALETPAGTGADPDGGATAEADPNGTGPSEADQDGTGADEGAELPVPDGSGSAGAASEPADGADAETTSEPVAPPSE